MVVASNLAWAEAVNQWLNRTRLRPTTKAKVRQRITTIGRIAEWDSVEDLRLDADPLGHVSDRLANACDRTESPWAESTASIHAQTFLAFAKAMRIKLPPDELAEFKAAWHPGKSFVRQGTHIFTEDEFNMILAAIPTAIGPKPNNSATGISLCRLGPTWWQAFLALLFDTGVRYGEADRIRWCDLDFDAKTIRIQEHLADQTHGVWPWKPKSKNGIRLLPMSLRLEAAIRKLPTESPYLFASKAHHRYLKTRIVHPGKYLTMGLQPSLNLIIKAAGLPKATFHDLRKSRATLWSKNPKVSPKMLQMLMGHSDFATTMKYYAHIDAQDAVNAARET